MSKGWGMLPDSFIILAILLRFASGASYLRATWKGNAQPHLASWSLWSLTALVAFAIQLVQGGGAQAFVTLAIGLSPTAVCAVALYRRTGITKLSRSDKYCVLFAFVGILLWIMSKDPLTMLFMSILADMFSEVPTLRKAYLKPHTEHATAYALTIASMVVALLTITNWHIVQWLFQAYILAINIAIFVTIVLLSKLRGYRFAPFKRLQNEDQDV